MKLNISETIKRLRKEKEVTQEVLASALGVSCQSVSRWENGVAYPDIELIPTIAAFFGISTDTLFGCDEQSVEEKVRLAFQIDIENDLTTKEKIAKLREIIADIPNEPQPKYHLISQYSQLGLEAAQKNLTELRQLAEFILDSKAATWIKHNTAMTMIRIEESEDTCDVWFNGLDLGGRFNISADTALMQRYAYRNEYGKYNVKSQELLVSNIKTVCRRYFLRYDEKGGKIPSSRVEGERTALAMIDALRDPKIEVDAWILARAFSMLRLAGGLFGCGRVDEGFDMLEKSIDLYESFFKLPADHVFRYNCSALDQLKETKSSISAHNSDEIEGMMLETNLDTWGWFDPVRNTERFKALVNKVQSFTPLDRVQEPKE